MGCPGSKTATAPTTAPKAEKQQGATPLQDVNGEGTMLEQSELTSVSATCHELTDNVVTLAPYFKIDDMEKFKSIWQEDYAKFAHKEDCVHYAFTFTDDNRAHCREAYPNAEKVLQHLADVDAPLNAVLDGPAKLERLEAHGPQAELDKLKSKLSPMGCLFYVVEWGIRPAKPAMETDTVCHLYPYFKIKQSDTFKQIWQDNYPSTKANMGDEKSHQYAFSFADIEGINVASCRESYADAEGILLHLKNVDSPLKAVLAGPAELSRLEVHAPASEIEKLKPALEPLDCQFFTIGWGFRNAVSDNGIIDQSALMPQGADGTAEANLTGLSTSSDLQLQTNEKQSVNPAGSKNPIWCCCSIQRGADVHEQTMA